ncbi:unnamed protein product [Spirodela intermedia]|uniref:VQ domain-containing protein n=1 Tax=Spirodela intermedia TaxID=51605 RepID=A0A7I8IC53_SPIIN|nr:unnamed protein product [Spirodela intermedia]CAA6654461.1 unnamed protein product [Spirodela intermedia]
MANDCFGLGAWSFPSGFAGDSDAGGGGHEMEMSFSRALQMSFSSDADILAAIAGDGISSSFLKSEPTAPFSASDAEAPPKPSWGSPAISPTGKKISKRKSRATKRSTTTYITADPANFREMVQQVTGIRFGGGSPELEDLVYKPEPQMSAGGGLGALQGGRLPTLDTSSFLLESAVASPPSTGSSFGSPALDGGGPAFDLEPRSFPYFPTLESWRVM